MNALSQLEHLSMVKAAAAQPSYPQYNLSASNSLIAPGIRQPTAAPSGGYYDTPQGQQESAQMAAANPQSHSGWEKALNGEGWQGMAADLAAYSNPFTGTPMGLYRMWNAAKGGHWGDFAGNAAMTAASFLPVLGGWLAKGALGGTRAAVAGSKLGQGVIRAGKAMEAPVQMLQGGGKVKAVARAATSGGQRGAVAAGATQMVAPTVLPDTGASQAARLAPTSARNAGQFGYNASQGAAGTVANALQYGSPLQ